MPFYVVGVACGYFMHVRMRAILACMWLYVNIYRIYVRTYLHAFWQGTYVHARNKFIVTRFKQGPGRRVAMLLQHTYTVPYIHAHIPRVKSFFNPVTYQQRLSLFVQGDTWLQHSLSNHGHLLKLY